MLSPVIVRPAFYGLLAFAQAVRGGGRLLPAVAGGAGDRVKVWPLWDGAARQLRVVVINKRASEAVDATLRIPKAGGFGAASISRLVASGGAPLEAKSGITLGGVAYGLGGKAQGAPASEVVPRVGAGGRSTWRVYMPPGSAAIVTIERLY